MGRKGKMQDAVIESDYLGESMTIKWYLPEDFTPFRDYQLCIMHDGDDYFQMGRVATLSDQLHEEMEIEPTIFIGLHYQDRFDRQQKYHPNGKQQKAYISFLIKEALPFVEDQLHLNPLASQRALMGDSLAGTLSFMVATQYSHTFGKVIMQSPLVNDKVLERAESANQWNHLEMYHSIGTQETEVKTTSGEKADFLTPNRNLQELLAPLVNGYTYEEFNGNHTWKYWQKDMKNILVQMFGI
ncbi:alpha/beta hydrolase-fold protein [Gracilibacillus sp. YIM 98692]|uniref:alpha/beta hydrolase n=1 Tax=Gracilibacillus sp. YIM 98692 TaxID=2663532 RepID=UPI0013D701F4|nr:alpha/beta hydrolase-fold protein [Gracilibacillus sp. YIM 98692]